MSDNIQCKVTVPSTGKQCTKTGDSTGFCHIHKDAITVQTEFQLLKCNNCPVRKCNYRNEGAKGICYFELMDDTKDFDSREKVQKAMRSILRTEHLLHGRIEREVSRQDFGNMGEKGDKSLIYLKQLGILSTSFAIHLERFGHFMGYEASETEDKSKEKKQKFIESLLKKDEKKRVADKEQEKLEEERKARLVELVKR